MTLYDWVRNEVKKLTFVEKTEFIGSTFKIYYKINNKLYHKKLPYRTNKNQLIECIETIKKEINYTKIKKQRDELVKKQLEKDMKEKTCLFAYTWGENKNDQN